MNKDNKIVLSAILILLVCCVVFTSAGDIEDITGQSFLSKLRFWKPTTIRKIREPVGAECYDSDGDNPNKLGYVKLGNKKELDFCSTSGRKERDESRFKVSDCSGTGCYVAEYVCSNNNIVYKKVKCPNGCENGACSVTVPTKKCYDSDGLNLGIKGTTTGIAWGTNDYVTKTDVCSTKLKDGIGEYFCMGNQVASQTYACPLKYKCEDGKCVPGEEEPTPACYDSDGGLDYTKKGYVKGVNKMGQEVRWEDSCGKPDAIVTDPDYLMEMYCSEDNIVNGDDALSKPHIYKCPNGCENGACKSSGGDYLTTSIEYRDHVDFSNVEIPAPYGITLGSSEKTIQISSIGIDALSFVDNPLLKTTRVWLVKYGIDLLVFYYDPDLLPNIRFVDDIDLGEVKSLLNLREGSNIKISPFSNTINLYFTKENAQMGMFFTVRNEEINSLGDTQSLAESNELKYSNLDTGFGEYIGTHEGSYIVVTNKGPLVVKDPKTNGASDQVVMDVQI